MKSTYKKLLKYGDKRIIKAMVVKHIHIKTFLLLVFLTVGVLAAPSSVLATEDSAQSANSVIKTTKPNKKKTVIYERPTMKRLSQLYWAAGKFEPTDDLALDHFLMINECDLYREYSKNEFEWTGIRESAREFVQVNRNNFPTHFELLQPIRLGEYDVEEGQFHVAPEFQIEGVRRFEVLAEDLYSDVCDVRYGEQIEGYPKGLHVEMSRPFSLTSFEIQPELARIYIESINKKIKDKGMNVTTKQELYDARNAYLVMRLRIISYKEDKRVNEYYLSSMLGLLESYTIYGDKERDLILFEENFKRKRKLSQAEIEMKNRYQARLKKQMEEKRRKEKMEENIRDINNIKNVDIEK